MANSEKITLRVSDRKEIQREIKRLELAHDDIWDADKTEIYDAIVWLALDNPDLLQHKLEKIQEQSSENKSPVQGRSDRDYQQGDHDE